MDKIPFSIWIVAAVVSGMFLVNLGYSRPQPVAQAAPRPVAKVTPVAATAPPPAIVNYYGPHGSFERDMREAQSKLKRDLREIDADYRQDMRRLGVQSPRDLFPDIR